jgi:class 3 adenylate cyclase
MTTRRLAAILAADMAAFSSMMENYEERTLKRRPGRSSAIQMLTEAQ